MTEPMELLKNYNGRVSQLITLLDLDAVTRVLAEIQRVRDAGGMIYLAGNGGSSATAAHLANDLGKAAKRSRRRPIKVVCLTDNTPWLTALSNDEGYERSLSGQLENFATPGDLLIVISASGNSANLLNAVAVAKSRGVTTAALLGFDGGRLKSLADLVVWVRSEIGEYEAVEDSHMVICHGLVRCLVEDVVQPGSPERAQ